MLFQNISERFIWSYTKILRQKKAVKISHKMRFLKFQSLKLLELTWYLFRREEIPHPYLE